MNNRQTLCQPDVKNLQYALLEQKGEENMYRLSGRKIQDGIQGDLVHILGTAQEINNYAGDEIVHLSEDEKKIIKAKECASKLNEVFLKLKEENPLKTEINVYGDSEGWKAITDLVDGSGKDAPILFDDKLKTALEEYGLTFSRPAYDYFVQKEKAGTVWFNVRFIGNDTIREETMNRKAKECASKLNEVFLKLKEKNPLKTEINVYGDSEGWKAITDLVDGSGKDAPILFDDKLKTALEEYGLTFSHPAYDYFVQKEKAGTVWFNVMERELKRAA